MIEKKGEKMGYVVGEDGLSVQDADSLDASTLTPLSPEVISRQATINIGACRRRERKWGGGFGIRTRNFVAKEQGSERRVGVSVSRFFCGKKSHPVRERLRNLQGLG